MRSIQKTANLLAGQLRLAVSALTALMVTRLIIGQLGIDAYVTLAIALAAVSAFSVLGNGVTDANVRYVSRAVARDDWRDTGVFVSNSLFSVLILVILGCLILLIGQAFKPQMWGGYHPAFPLVLLGATLPGLWASIFRSGNFIRERFVSSALAFSSERILYLSLVYLFVSHTGLSAWSIPISLALSNLYLAAVMLFLFRRCLPSVPLGFRQLSLDRVRLVVTFTGYMLLVYSGVYLTGGGLLVLSRSWIPSNIELARLALAMQVGSLSGQLIMCFSYLTSPGIYKSLAVGLRKEALQHLEHLFLLTAVALIGGAYLLHIEGEGLLKAWIGTALPPQMRKLLVPSIFSFGIASLSVPICAYYAALGRIKWYGGICLVEGVVTFLAALALLSFLDSQDQVYAIVALPGLIGILKLIYLFIRAEEGLTLRTGLLAGWLTIALVAGVGPAEGLRLLSKAVPRIDSPLTRLALCSVPFIGLIGLLITKTTKDVPK